MSQIDHALAAIAQGRFEDAMAILEPLAQAGDAEAQFLLGHLCFTDADIEHAEAAEWAARAAAQRHPDALFCHACFAPRR